MCVKIMFFYPLCQPRFPEILLLMSWCCTQEIFIGQGGKDVHVMEKIKEREGVTISEKERPPFVHSTTIKVCFGDTDLYGIVYCLS